MADLVITPADVFALPGARILRGIAGQTVAAGQSVYKKAADDKLWLADSNAAATADAKGVALNSAAADQPLTYCISGPVDLGEGVLTYEGHAYSVSDTAGGIGALSERGDNDYITIHGYSKLYTTPERIILVVSVISTGVLMTTA